MAAECKPPKRQAATGEALSSRQCKDSGEDSGWKFNIVRA